MSSVLNFIVEVSDHYRETLIEALEKQAKKHNIGVWYPGSAHFYMEQYIPYIAPPKSLIFDLPPPFVHYVFIHQLQIKTCILELNENA